MIKRIDEFIRKIMGPYIVCDVIRCTAYATRIIAMEKGSIRRACWKHRNRGAMRGEYDNEDNIAVFIIKHAFCRSYHIALGSFIGAAATIITLGQCM